jgi:hypothetical protein
VLGCELQPCPVAALDHGQIAGEVDSSHVAQGLRQRFGATEHQPVGRVDDDRDGPVSGEHDRFVSRRPRPQHVRRAAHVVDDRVRAAIGRRLQQHPSQRLDLSRQRGGVDVRQHLLAGRFVLRACHHIQHESGLWTHVSGECRQCGHE